ncbi:spore gernimation protein GerD [Priestia filamentosa]|uniref:spore germination lipoprotein GerD n=1 Tax=Priestia filamentosa TaxID=1402861 RepID=UPI001FB1D755|nr:spore germination lipoprotein GerD [Priestia filamentosa]MED3727412.1 spore germination lipoprotein GerD [Priestia filamentosa]UOE60446.1 spore gernimation protein GerD [Priestia filamentosa]
MGRALLLLYALIFVFSSSGCAPQEAEGSEMDYDQTKKMVVDILKTDDGKEALKQVLKDDEVKKEIVIDEKLIKETIQDTLSSEKGSKFWTEAFKDPKFAKTLATSLQDEHEEIIKKLMKDPEYQQMLMDVLKNPEMEKEVTKLLKSKEYRKHLQTVITETFESPTYKGKVQEMIDKAVKEAESEEKKEE